ncbi:ATP-binding protein [Roseovarius sp.]|uniref:PAS domain-containing sensor histidine kinase n=1 Tax=Roseovarius sp. TaxID=1486281 RepID=UPI003568BA6D
MGLTEREHREPSRSLPSPWWLLAALAVVFAPLLVWIAGLTLALPLRAILFAAFASSAGVAIGLVFSVWAYRSALQSLSDGLVQAQDGTLQAVEVPRTADPILQAIYEDYNTTITTLDGMFALVEDCQSRVLTERNHMNAVVQVLPAALLGVDDNLLINSSNKQAANLFGLSERNLKGQSLFDVVNLAEQPREILRDSFLYKQDIRNQVVNLSTALGERWLSMNLSFVTEDEAEMAAVITLLDITDYKYLQESVYTREKLVAMGQLAGGVAHELNTPLGSILGYSQLLMDCCEDPVRARQFARTIAEETKRCSRVIQNLVNYARKETCDRSSCQVVALIDELLETLMSCRLKRSRIRLEREPSEEIIVDGSCGELDIVLTNLLLNSVHALDDVEEPVIRIRTRMLNDREAVVVVEDNGPGVPKDVRARIFDPFFSTKEVGEGSGLGLSISHAMIAKRGGELSYDSNFTDGARFVIRLPSVSRHEVRE